MAIKFKTQSRKNPQDWTVPMLFYAAAIIDGSMDLDRLAALILYQGTVTAPDCSAVLLALEHNISGELGGGRIVKMGRLGNFQVGLNSIGLDSAAEVSASVVTKGRILFRPAKQLRSMLNDVSFKKAG